MRNKSLLIASIFALTLASDAFSQWVHPGPAGGSVTSFTSSGSDLYVSIRSGGVFHSRDSGITWMSASTGLTDTSVALVTAFRSIVIAVTDSAGLFRTTDKGTLWSPANNGLPENHRYLSFAAVGTIIFVATDSGIYRSSDGALHWIPADTGLHSDQFSLLRSNGVALYFSNGLQVFRSEDSGVTWVNVSKGLISNYLISDLRARDSLVFAVTRSGCFRSTDRGRNWEGPYTMGLQINGQFFGLGGLLLRDTTLFGLTSYGYNQVAIFRSTTNGQTWVRMDTAEIGLDTSDSSPFLNNFGSILLSGDGDGVVRSSDGGISWRRSNSGIRAYDTGYRILAPFAYIGHTLIARSGAYYLNYKFYSSRDFGVHWSGYTALDGYHVNDVAVLGRYAFAATDSEGILRSSDSGATWSVLDGMSNVYPVTSLTVVSGGVLAATNRGGGVFRSTDSGATWIHVKSDWQQAEVASNGRYAFALFFDDQSITYHNIYRSTDSGKTWKELTQPGEYVWIARIWANKNFVFVGGSYALFRSMIDSSNWQDVNRPGSQYSLLVTDSEIFLGTATGVSISKDNGDHWNSAGLANYSIRNFLIADGYLFAGTGGGVWRRPLSDFPPGPPAFVQSENLKQTDLLLTPNPTGGSITVFVKSKVTHVTITDLLGQSLIEFSNPRSGNFTLDLSKLSAGTYFARFAIGGEIVTRKIVKE